MQWETLKIFCDVVRWESFSRGARENGVSQSTASQSVHQLEQRLGVKLIDRSKRPLQLTPHGQVYYEGCRELVGRYQELEDRVKGLEDDQNVVGAVRVASIYSAGLNHIQQFVRRFHERHPGASVRVDYLHPTRVVEAVTGGDAELGLISFPRKWPDLEVIPWREEEMVLAIPPAHRLASRDEVDVRELDGETFVGFDADLSIRRAIDRFLRLHEVHVKVALEFDNIENIKRAVEIASGVAILPRPTLVGEVRIGTLATASFADARLARPLAIVHRRSEPLGLTASRFLGLLRTGADPSSPARPTAAVTADGHRP
jgi:DNA-binding transcriptional LysR family regulator